MDGRVLDPGGSERVFWPEVEPIAAVEEIEEPLDLRAQVFKAFNRDWSESTALDVLNSLGAWRTVNANGLGSRCTKLAYGHRMELTICVLPITLAEMHSDIERWYKLLSALNDPTKLKSGFKRPPSVDARPHDLFAFAGDAHFNNTLPVSLEWSGKDPCAVVETITGWELMTATAWADVAGRADEQVCANCGTRFTWPRKKKHCRWECGHLAAVRKYKRKRKRKAHH